MSIKSRITWSIALVFAFAFLLGYYSHFAAQAQADATLAQVNGDNQDFAVAKMAARDYTGYIVGVGIFTILAIWAGALKQLVCRIAAER